MVLHATVDPLSDPSSLLRLCLSMEVVGPVVQTVQSLSQRQVLPRSGTMAPVFSFQKEEHSSFLGTTACFNSLIVKGRGTNDSLQNIFAPNRRVTSGYPRGRKQGFVDEKQTSEETQKMTLGSLFLVSVGDGAWF